MAQPSTGPGFGALAMMGARMTLKVALQMALNNRGILDFVAGKLYSEETRKQNWQTIPANEKAIWTERTRIVVSALAETVG